MILGPTAIGKTALAFALQDQLQDRGRSVRLISMDSTLVYRGMDIGTGKPTQAELDDYPHALIDLRAPHDPYTAADFVRDADAEVSAAWQAGQLPILVGGTMLYAKRFCDGIAQLPSADPQIRAELTTRYTRGEADLLYAELQSMDPDAAREIHPHNQQRLLRALEVLQMLRVEDPQATLSGRWAQDAAHHVEARLGMTPRIIGLIPGDRAHLRGQIEARFDAMLEAGFVEEARALVEAAPKEHPPAAIAFPAYRAVGYRQIWPYLAGEIDHTEFRRSAIVATRRLAKRQLTWMRGWPELEEIPLDLTSNEGAKSQILALATNLATELADA